MHDPLEDWAEKDRLLAEIGVEPASTPEPPAPEHPPPLAPALGPARVVPRAIPAVPELSAPGPVPPPVERAGGGRRAVASVVLLGVGVAWLASGAASGSAASCLAGLAFLASGAIGFLPALRA